MLVLWPVMAVEATFKAGISGGSVSFSQCLMPEQQSLVGPARGLSRRPSGVSSDSSYISSLHFHRDSVLVLLCPLQFFNLSHLIVVLSCNSLTHLTVEEEARPTESSMLNFGARGLLRSV